MLEWKWTKEQLESGRIARAHKVKLSGIVVDEDMADCRAECVSRSTGEIYCVSLSSCTCRDFTVGKQPCKHMIRLAMEKHLINSDGRTPQEEADAELQSRKEALARAYGYYYLFKEPVMSDPEYDRLKFDVADDWGFGDDSEKIMAAIQSGRGDEKRNLNIIIYQGILHYLQEAKAEYVDMVSLGGSLYFFR